MVYADGWRRSCIDFLLDFKLCNKNLFLARYKKKKPFSSARESGLFNDFFKGQLEKSYADPKRWIMMNHIHKIQKSVVW